MTVLAVHPVHDKDLTGALRYGEVSYINNRYVYADELGDDGSLPDEPHRRLLAAAGHFDPARDYMLIAGDHLQMVALAAALGRRCEAFNALRYDREARGYVSVKIEG